MRYFAALLTALLCIDVTASHVILYTHNPSYDTLPITPMTWEEIDLSYTNKIKDHQYTNSIQLLRPIKWLKIHNMDKVGNHIVLSIPEFGINNLSAQIKAIKPTTLDSRLYDWSKTVRRPVIGIFKHYVTKVRTYTIKDDKNRIFHINATPNHPFYIQNQHGFMPIGNINNRDQLVGTNGLAHLVCHHRDHKLCGLPYGSADAPVPVYNLEIYKRHVYLIGGNALLVHNACYNAYSKTYLEGKSYEEVSAFIIRHTNDQIKISDTRSALENAINMTSSDSYKTIRSFRAHANSMTETQRQMDDLLADLASDLGYGNCGEMCAFALKSLDRYGYEGRLYLIDLDDGGHTLVGLGKAKGIEHLVDPFFEEHYPLDTATANMQGYRQNLLSKTEYKGEAFHYLSLTATDWATNPSKYGIEITEYL